MFLSKRSCLITTIPHINYWDQLNSRKNFWKFWNGPLYRNKSGPSPLLNAQYIGRAATPKLVPTDCLRYLQTTLIIGGGELASEFMSGIAASNAWLLNTSYVYLILPPYSILQYIGKVATPKLVQRNCLRVLVPFLWGGIFDKRSTLFLILCQWVP